MILISWMYRITFLALQKCYGIVFRVSAVDGCSYVPSKLPMNMAHRWSQL
jgi:hypothetical protein